LRSIARSLSIVLHPLLMPLITLWLAMELDPLVAFLLPDQGRFITLAMVALMTVVFPITSTLLLKRAGLVSSLELPTRQERLGPYIMTVIYYAMTWYLLLRAPLDVVASRLFFGATVAVMLTALITIRWKISAHMVGMGGLIGALAGLNVVHGLGLFPIFVVAIILAGMLGTARLLTSDHTVGQVLAGALLGVCCTYTSVITAAVQ